MSWFESPSFERSSLIMIGRAGLSRSFNYFTWNEWSEGKFIETMLADVTCGKVRLGKFGRECHEFYASLLTRFGTVKYTEEQVKEKIKRLKKRLGMFTDLMGQTGMGWDPKMKKVTDSDEHWANDITINKEWKRFCNRGFPFYDDLCSISATPVAIGTLHYPGSSAPHGTDISMRHILLRFHRHTCSMVPVNKGGRRCRTTYAYKTSPLHVVSVAARVLRFLRQNGARGLSKWTSLQPPLDFVLLS
ncbi:hypothetical protein I3843_07G021700 [Carya illinoinensis]|nr:hypothetical protein I3843_07G021700 [Carya illinoinensis]